MRSRSRQPHPHELVHTRRSPTLFREAMAKAKADWQAQGEITLDTWNALKRAGVRRVELERALGVEPGTFTIAMRMGALRQ